MTHVIDLDGNLVPGDLVRVCARRPALRVEGTGVVVESIRSMYFTVLVGEKLCTVWPSELERLERRRLAEVVFE